MIKKAMGRILLALEIPLTKLDIIVDTMSLLEMRGLARVNAISGPYGLIVIARTYDQEKSSLAYLNSVVRSLIKTGLVKPNKLKQFHFDKVSSAEEILDVYLILCDDG